MRKVRSDDGSGNVINEYLYCGKKRNKPRVHHRVCESKCKNFESCPYYYKWKKRVHGEEVEPAKK